MQAYKNYLHEQELPACMNNESARTTSVQEHTSKNNERAKLIYASFVIIGVIKMGDTKGIRSTITAQLRGTRKERSSKQTKPAQTISQRPENCVQPRARPRRVGCGGTFSLPFALGFLTTALDGNLASA